MQNQKMTEWLDKVCAYKLTPSQRRIIRKELTAHLNDRIRQLENDGLSHEQAVEQAIVLMGDAEKIGRAFSKDDKSDGIVKRSNTNTMIWVSIIIVMIFVINIIIRKV